MRGIHANVVLNYFKYGLNKIITNGYQINPRRNILRSKINLLAVVAKFPLRPSRPEMIRVRFRIAFGPDFGPF